MDGIDTPSGTWRWAAWRRTLPVRPAGVSAARWWSGCRRVRAGRQGSVERPFTRPPTLDDLYFDNFAVFDRRAIRAVLSPAHRESLGAVDPYAAQHDLLARTDAGSLLNQLLHVDLFTYLHELLMKQDQMSMAASIESRVPFLDHPLVEFHRDPAGTAQAPGPHHQVRPPEAMRDALPAEILSRGKMGFPVPVGRWFREAIAASSTNFVLGERSGSRNLFDADVRQAAGQ
jgi:asparagine synthase (glutamine-hydrolysing)